jgi:ABC-type amino acid transport substrate-binding protein
MTKKPSPKRSGSLQALRLALALTCLNWLAPPSNALAGPVSDRVKISQTVRVCIWPDYYGVSLRNPRNQQYEGIDIDLSGAFAKDLGVKLEYVDSSFTKLIDDLSKDQCDVAMFAVGITPMRQQSLAFTRPYMQSDIYGVTTRNNRSIKNWEDIDKAGNQVAVQAGTFMEPIMAASLKNAKMVVISPPQMREQELESGRVDVFMTDYPYSRRLFDKVDWARLLSPSKPFHPTDYAYAVKPGDPIWLKQVDDFVTRIKQDGRLQAAAQKYGLSEIVIKK